MKAVDRRLGGEFLNKRDRRVREEVEGRGTRHRRAVTRSTKGDSAGGKIFYGRAHGI
jgi:hypothetical protein